MDRVENLVSIITPMYNGRRYIAETLDSVLAQSYANWEQIVVDDGSKDDSAAIVESYASRDSRIRLIRKPNGGSASARNKALELSKGRYVVFLDSDDLWDPDFLERQLAFIRTHDAPIVFASYRMIDSDGNGILEDFIVPPRVSYRDVLISCPLSCLTSMIDVEKTGSFSFDVRLGSVRDDLVMWLSLLKRVGVALGNPDVLASYRIHSASVTGSKWKMIKPQFRVYYRFEGLGVIRSLYYTFRWGLRGLLKYRKR